MPPHSNDVGPVGRRLAELVGAARRLRGMSRRLLSDVLADYGRPMSDDVIVKIEAGQRRVDLDDFVALSSVLFITLDEVIDTTRCSVCRGVPPLGFSCNRCGKEHR